MLSWWEQRDLNPPQRISSETTSLDEATVCRIATGRRSSWSSTVSKPTRRHSCATGARDTTKLYYTPMDCTPHQALACLRARLRRRSFLRRHFHRWFPVFFQAREPRFIVNKSPTDHPYMSASGYAALNPLQLFQKISLMQDSISTFFGSGRIRIRTRVFGLEGQSDIQATLYALIHRR
jgi:hypothetical protein